MGLLKGAGRELRGLFAAGGLIDNLGAAQAWLDGDYGRGATLAQRIRRDRLRGLTEPVGKDPLVDGQAPKDKYDGTIIEDEVTRNRMIFDRGMWRPCR